MLCVKAVAFQDIFYIFFCRNDVLAKIPAPFVMRLVGKDNLSPRNEGSDGLI